MSEAASEGGQAIDIAALPELETAVGMGSVVIRAGVGGVVCVIGVHLSGITAQD